MDEIENKRRSIDELLYRSIAFREPELGRTDFEDEAYRRDHLIIYVPAGGKNAYIATVDREDVFDIDGNRFGPLTYA